MSSPTQAAIRITTAKGSAGSKKGKAVNRDEVEVIRMFARQQMEGLASSRAPPAVALKSIEKARKDNAKKLKNLSNKKENRPVKHELQRLMAELDGLAAQARVRVTNAPVANLFGQSTFGI